MAKRRIKKQQFTLRPGATIHLVGIKGVAMTALAQVLKARGASVTGSDGPAHFFTDEILKKLKIKYAKDFSVKNIPADVDAVISSAAYLHNGKALNNIEVEGALEKKIQTFTYPEVMSELTKEYWTIGIAGSHGKSTTTALLGWVLTKCNIDPTVVVGSRVNKWNANARVGKSDVMVLEADEYRDAFLKYQVRGAVVTSIDYDHPDYFKTPEEYTHSFKRFVDGIRKKGFLAVCGDDAEAKKLSIYATEKGLRSMSYGFLPSNTIVLRDGGVVKPRTRAAGAQYGAAHQQFEVLFSGKKYVGTIPFVGKQYVLNSGAAFAVAVMMGIEPKKAIAAMASFPGTARRFEVVKKAKDYIIIDDYAHHPTAIKITLEGVRAMYPKSRIVAVFQPHMFSRTQALLDGFAQAFGAANEVGIMEIYPSARETAGPVNGKTLAAKAKFFHRRVTYLPDMESGKQYVKQRCKENNVIVLMGAGNVNELAE